MTVFKCPRDTDGDGNCAACARVPGGCFEKPKPDVIAQLREAWEKTTPGEWSTYSNRNGWLYMTPDNPENTSAFTQSQGNAAFIALAHNKMPEILAVLEAASRINNNDLFETSSSDGWSKPYYEMLEALSVLKGGSDGS